MMARSTTSVRMGPVSILTLVIVLCLAVMAVLSITTSSASLALSERQASFAGDDYANETVGQAFYAEIDDALAAVRASGGGAEAGAAAVSAQLDELIARANAAAVEPGALADDAGGNGNASGDDAGDSTTNASSSAAHSASSSSAPELSAAVDGTVVTAHAQSASGRCLDMTFEITDDAHVRVLAWKATTLWVEDATDVLWTGN